MIHMITKARQKIKVSTTCQRKNSCTPNAHPPPVPLKAKNATEQKMWQKLSASTELLFCAGIKAENSRRTNAPTTVATFTPSNASNNSRAYIIRIGRAVVMNRLHSTKSKVVLMKRKGLSICCSARSRTANSAIFGRNRAKYARLFPSMCRILTKGDKWRKRLSNLTTQEQMSTTE